MTEDNSDDTDYYCEQHELETPAYEGQMGECCPYCEQERKREAQLRHQMTRNPRVEPY
jgi:hypothetical protein